MALASPATVRGRPFLISAGTSPELGPPKNQLQDNSETAQQIILAQNMNPLGGRNPCTVSATASLRQSNGTFSSTAVPSRQDLNDSDRYPALVVGLVVPTLTMN